MSQVNDDRGHGAMPKLYGAPAYARPKVDAVPATSRPFDPDDLPIEAYRSDEEGADESLPEMQATPYATTAPATPRAPATKASAPKAHRKGPSIIQARPFRLKRPGRSGGSGSGTS